MSSETFNGWVCHDKSATEGGMKWESYEPKKFTDDDVQLKITHCGVCFSDVSTAQSGWGPTDYPAVVGHEIVGIVEKVGKNVKHLKVGQRAGVGAQSGSCLQCRCCTELEREPNCEKGLVGTYNGRYPNGEGKSYGGYAERSRLPAHFAVPIPDGLDSAIAGPLMCGGITAYAPLAENGVGKPGIKKVGVVGIGGIGAFGLTWAKALGAEQIVAISRSTSKKDDAMKLGATDIIATGTDEEHWHEKWAKKLDFVLITQNSATMPLDKYLSLLRPHGKAVVIGVPEGGIKTPTPLPQLLFGNTFLGGSAIGGTKLIADMLKLATDRKDELTFMIEQVPMEKANEALNRLKEGKNIRYRLCLVNPQ